MYAELRIAKRRPGWIDQPLTGASTDLEDPGLTPRELEVVSLVVDGRTNAGIARELWVAESTVKTHLASAARKTGMRTRTQLAVHALRTGMVPLHTG